MKVSVEQKGGQRCSYCRDHKLKGALVGCERCATIVHQECWDTNKGCPTPGCLRAIGDRGRFLVPEATPEYQGPALTWDQRAKQGWERLLSRHPRYASLDWKFITTMMTVIGTVLLLSSCAVVIHAIRSDLYRYRNIWPLILMVLSSLLIASAGFHLRRKA